MTGEDLDRAFQVLLTAEAEVARVPYPKLILEMALIKLATLTPVVAVGELLDRIDELERRLGPTASTGSGSTPAPSTEKPAAPVRREPAARAHSTAAEAADAVANPLPQPAGEQSWDAFVAFVAKEKVTLLPYLRSSQPSQLDGAVLTLRVPRGYYYDYLAQREHTQLVEELAQRFFGRALRVAVATNEVAEPEAAASAALDSPAALHAAALGNPVVRAAVEIFGGEVQEVKPRARREPAARSRQTP